MNDTKRSILVVEDDDDLRKILTQRLTTRGFRVLACGTIADALRMSSNQKFNCILLDVFIKGVTTEKILMSIRENKSNLNFATPVIVLSGMMDMELVRRLAGKINGALVKPFDFANLVNQIRTACGMEPEAEAGQTEALGVTAPVLSEQEKYFEEMSTGLSELQMLLGALAEQTFPGAPVSDQLKADITRALTVTSKVAIVLEEQRKKS